MMVAEMRLPVNYSKLFTIKNKKMAIEETANMRATNAEKIKANLGVNAMIVSF